MKLNKPILIVGHARGGTTLLSAIINWHSQVGPKRTVMVKYKDVNTFLNTLITKGSRDSHRVYSAGFERKDIWFKYFPKILDTYMHVGAEIIDEKRKFTKQEKKDIIEELTFDFKEERFLFKSPVLSFLLTQIKQLFSDVKIIVIYRHPLEVINSWMGGEYKKETKQIQALSYKWNEVFNYLNKCQETIDIHCISYDALVTNTSFTLEEIFKYCELPIENYIYDIKIEDRRNWYKEIMPKNIQKQIREYTGIWH